ncbi:unnamed protein product [Polarella glacialis]|uniref:gamma-glutamylcyclotransferase n=1 Tax=Polarella glacialis TaxID=89957 RepID=A0A813LGL7_POLGL|nr:unnamed protein product [Polarella glacialis]
MANAGLALRRYFSFGSNMSCAALAVRLGSPPVGKAKPSVLLGWELCFDVPGYWPLVEGAFAAAAQREGSSIYGVVHLLSEAQLQLLDDLEGVPDGQNVRVEGGVASLLADPSVTEECCFYACPAASRLLPGSAVNPSHRYLELMEFGAREMNLPEEWTDQLSVQRQTLPETPQMNIEELLRDFDAGATLPFSTMNGSQNAGPLTALCGIVFECGGAPAAVMPAISGQEVGLAALRRAAQTWLGEVPPVSVEEARQKWGEARVTKILERWLAQFRSMFGKPIARLSGNWEDHATAHRLPL